MKLTLKILLLISFSILLLSFTKTMVKHNQSSSTLLQNNSVTSFTNQATSVSLLKLIEQGKIKMDDKVFGPGAILGNTFGTLPYDEAVLQLTVRDLLQATASLKNEGIHETIFTNASMSAQELIGWSLDNLLLNKEPGTSVALSNFSFCVQAQLIEKITGPGYSAGIVK